MKTTTQKAEGLLNTAALSLGEKQFLQSLKQFLGNAKENTNTEIATAARRWERVLAYRIRVALQYRRKGKGVRRQNSEASVTKLPHPQPSDSRLSQALGSGEPSPLANSFRRFPSNSSPTSGDDGVEFSPVWKEAA